MDTAIWISVGVVVLLLVLLGLYLWVSYTSFVTLRTRVDEAWRDIAEQQRLRAELVPRLVESVRQYAPEDRPVFEAVQRAREETLSAAGPSDATVAESHMQQALRSVSTAAGTYPPLQSSTDYLQLQGELAESEERIQASRRFYNGGVREFNAKRRVFPSRLFANRAGFGEREFFETSAAGASAEPPRIQF
jgi:LemA protein